MLIDNSVALSQVNTFCFNSRNHVYKTVLTPQKAGEILGHILCKLSQASLVPRPIHPHSLNTRLIADGVSFSLNARDVE